MDRRATPTLVATATLVFLAFLSADGHAAGSPGQVCAGAKLTATGKDAAKSLVCHAGATKHGTATNPACLAAAHGKLAAAFAKAEARGGCITTGDAGGIAGTIDASVGSIAAALRPVTTANGCAAAKLKAAGKKVGAKFRCQAKATSRGLAVDPACLGKAEARFTAGFLAAEAHPPCLTTGDAADIESRADQLLAAALSALTPAGTTTTSTTTTTTLGPVCGNGIREGAEECDTTAEPFCVAGGRSGCFPADDLHACECCTLPLEYGLVSLDGRNYCCNGPSEPAGPGVYFCPGTCGSSAYPTCGGSCPSGTTCVPVTNDLGGFCFCGPPGPCDGTCNGAECPTGQACHVSTCSCVSS